MSNVIDNRVVKMDFDNGNFERNAKTSLSTLDKLKNALDFRGMSNSLSELSKSASHFNMYGVENAADLVKDKFSALEIIGVGALMRIGQQAVDTGERLVKSMSTDQIMAGWDKFSKKTTSTATMLGQGFSMTEVEEQLKRLNWFTDETSYNFTDMVDSIGKFTASGKGLVESVDAMQGIANWAALSGQNAATASRAMYQLSQAMGSGVMKKEDYKSIQNAAMDTDEFRQHALDAAIALGTLKKNSDGTYSSLVAVSKKGKEAFSKSQFADHLTEGLWLTDKVMMKVFNDYSKGLDQINKFMTDFGDENDMLTSQVIRAHEEFKKGSAAFDKYADSLNITDEARKGLLDLVSNLDDFGVKAFGAAQKARTFEDAIDSVKDAASTTWMNIFELFIGNAEKATEVWTDLANYLWFVFVGPIDNLKDLLEEWIGALENGSDDILDIFRNIARFASSVTRPIKDAFAEIFPAASGVQFKAFIDNLNRILVSLKLNSSQSKKLNIAFKGLFTVLKKGLNIFKTLVVAMKPILGIAKDILNVGLEVAYRIGAAITGVNDEIEDTLGVSKKVSDVVSIIMAAIHKLQLRLELMFKNIRDGQSVIKEIGKLAKTTLDTLIKSVLDIFTAITGINTDKIYNFITNILSSVWDAFKKFFENFKNGGGLKGVIQVFFDMLKDIGITILEVFEDVTGIDLTNMKARFQGLIDGIKENLEEFVQAFTGMDSITSKFERLAEALDKVKKFFEPINIAVRDFITGVLDKLKNYPWLSFTTIINAKIFLDICNAIKELITTIPNLLNSFKDIKDSVVGTLGAVKDTLKAVQTELQYKTLMAIAASVTVLAVALLLMSGIESEKIAGTIGAFTAVISELIIAIGALSFMSDRLGVSGLLKMVAPILALSAAIYVLTQALINIGSSGGNLDEIATNVILLAFLFGYLIAALAILDSMNIKGTHIAKLILIGVFAKSLSTAIKILAEAVAIINSGNVDELGPSILAMIASLIAVIKAVQNLEGTNSKGLIKIGVAMILMATSMRVLASAINAIDATNPEALAESFIVVGVAMATMAATMNKIAGTKVFLTTALAMIAMAYAVRILVDTIMDLSNYNGADLAKGFIIMAGSLAVLAIMTNLLQASLFKAGVGLLFVSIALNIVASALKKMQELDLTKMAEDASLLIVMMYALVGIAKMGKKAIEGAAGILIISAALFVLAEAFKLMNDLDFVQMALDAALLIVALYAMVGIANMAGEVIIGAAALVILAGAFLIFAAACNMIAKNNPKQLLEDMAIAIGSLAILIAGLMGVAAIFSAFGSALILGAALFLAAMALISLGLAALGGAIIVLGIGVNTFAATGGAAAEAITLLGDALEGRVKTLLEGAGALALLGGGMLLAGLGAAVMAVGGIAIAAVLLALTIALASFAGAIALLNLALGSFATNGKAAGEALVTMSTDMLKASPSLVAAGAELLLLKPTLEKLTKMFVEFTNSSVLLGDSMITLNMAFNQFNGSVMLLAQAADTFQTSFTKMHLVVTTAMSQLRDNLVTGATNIFASATTAFQKIGANLIIGFINGMNSKVASAYMTLSKMAAKCVAITRSALGVHSPSRVFAEIGAYTVEGFAQGLSDTRSSDAAAESMGESAINSLQTAMASAYDNLDSDISDPVIKPVMDLSEIQNGSNNLDAMLSRDRATSINANYRTKRSYEEEAAEQNASLMTNLNNKLLGAMSSDGEEQSPFNINVVLEGNAGEIFRLIRVENERFVKSAGYSPLLR